MKAIDRLELQGLQLALPLAFAPLVSDEPLTDDELRRLSLAGLEVHWTYETPAGILLIEMRDYTSDDRPILPGRTPGGWRMEL